MAKHADAVEGIRKRTEILLKSEERDEIYGAANDLFKIFSRAADYDHESDHPDHKKDIITSTGKNLCSFYAATIVQDGICNSKFLRGLREAILLMQTKYPNQPIEVVYPLCGPFATFAITMATQFGPQEVKFTCVDAHERNIQHTKQIFANLGLDDYLRDAVVCDPAAYEHPKDKPIHIAVFNCVQMSLSTMPHVAVSINMAKQLVPDGILLPEEVTVDAYLCDIEREYKKDVTPDRKRLGRVFALTLESARNIHTHQGVQCVIPQLEKPMMMLLRIVIKVFGNHIVEEGVSGCTIPHAQPHIGRLRGGEKIIFGLQIEHRPGNHNGVKCQLEESVIQPQ